MIKDIDESIKGIILSGGPLNVYQINKYSFDKKILKFRYSYFRNLLWSSDFI